MASGEMAMSEKARPWAPPPLISFKAGSSSGRRFRSFGNRGSPAKGKESTEKPEHQQAAPVSDPDKDGDNTPKQERPDATPKKPEQNPESSTPEIQAPVGLAVNADKKERPEAAAQAAKFEKPEESHDDVEEGELPGDEAMVNEIKEKVADEMEEGDQGLMVEELEQADEAVGMQVEKVDEEELEEGELPSSEAADVMERDREAHAAQQTSPILGLVNPAAAPPEDDEPMEFTLADWHLHVTTGKPLPRRQAQKPPENPKPEPTPKKKKSRKRKKPSKESASKKPKIQSTPTGTNFARPPMKATPKTEPGVSPFTPAATMVSPGVSLFAQPPTPAATKVPPGVSPFAQPSATKVEPGVSPVEAKVKLEVEAPAVVKHEQQQESKAPAAASPKKPEEKEPEMTLTMMIEKQLGIWTDPVEEKQKKKRVLTAERKKKKRTNERIKRAEKDREMGITRRKPLVFKPIEKPLQVCKYFLKGRCSKGDDCTFSHQAIPDTKQYLCKYFLTHCCLKGEDCPFSHEPANFPCKFLVTRGFCKDGDQCRFSHEPISDEERDKLLKRVLSEKKEHDASVYEEAIFPAATEDSSQDYEPDYNPDIQPEYDPAPASSCWWKPSSGSSGGGDEDYDPAPATQVDGLSYSTNESDENEWCFNRRVEEEKKLAAFEASRPSCSGKSKSDIMDLLQQTLNESGGVF